VHGISFFETCRDVNIDAVKGTDGKLYTVKDTFDDVDEYEDHGVTAFCFVRVKQDDWYSSFKSWMGWIGWIMGYNWQQTFLTDKGDGKFERADPEYLVFRCKKQEWPAPGSADTELGVLMEAEVCHGETEVHTRVQA
jgi:hypothetical protein